MVGNLAVKRNFQTYIRQYTSPNEKIEYGYPHSNALLQFELKLEHCKPHKVARHPTKGDAINTYKITHIVAANIPRLLYLVLTSSLDILLYAKLLCEIIQFLNLLMSM